MTAHAATAAAIVSMWSRMRRKPSTEGTRQSESVRKPHPDAALCCHRELDDDNELPPEPTSRKSSCCSVGSCSRRSSLPIRLSVVEAEADSRRFILGVVVEAEADPRGPAVVGVLDELR
ncbi:hypothetical protein ZWY2020_034821 [Hordeum vulgare]|nr:hypothetical protein ZWY2020_034821 [Hordeum vulgare]